VMLGYLKEPKATADAFGGGWMHTGDLAVEHPNGYVEIKDRAKDIIISGGENISSVEVEIALYKHPAVQLAAVVARPDSKWGETPCAFVQLKPGTQATEDEIIAFCRDRLAHFKAPKSVGFDADDCNRQGAEVHAEGARAKPVNSTSRTQLTTARVRNFTHHLHICAWRNILRNARSILELTDFLAAISLVRNRRTKCCPVFSQDWPWWP
jgi:hypothetical protein